MLEIFFGSRYSRKWLFSCPILARDSKSPENFCLSIRNWNPTNEWNPESGIRNPRFTDKKKSGIRNPESGIYGVESGIQVCLGFPYVGQVFSTATYKVLLMQDFLKVSISRKHSITRLTFLFISKS